MLQIRYTNDYAEACRLRDDGYEPIECAFGQYGSVLGEHAMDHHGTERHREGVALRACRDLYGARAADPRFVVTGTPDADAVLSIVALAALVPRVALRPEFYRLIDAHDVDPIGMDLLSSEDGELLAWFNQRQGLGQSEAGFRKAIGFMRELLTEGVPKAALAQVAGADRSRRRRALSGVVSRWDRDGLDLPVPEDIAAQPVLRGDAALAAAARVLVVHSSVWGFDQWYRLAPVVVSFASRQQKVTVGCPDLDTAVRLFGPGGLMAVWPRLGKGWGGRESIGGSPRGVHLATADATAAAKHLLPALIG